MAQATVLASPLPATTRCAISIKGPSGSILPVANVELVYLTDTSATDLVGLK